jgi:hypothetical protein
MHINKGVKMNKIKRLWIRITNPALYGAILECERLQKKIAIKKRYHEKYSNLQKQLCDVRARVELLRGKK